MTLRAPSLREFWTLSGVALAVMTRISGLKLIFFMSAISSRPVNPGMWMSVRTTSTRFDAKNLTASGPLPAESRRMSCRPARSSFRRLRMFGASSMIRRLQTSMVSSAQVDDPHALLPLRTRRHGGAGRHLGQRYPDGEGGPFADLALDGDLPFVLLDDAVRDRQAEPGPLPHR